jgi:plastocyanin
MTGLRISAMLAGLVLPSAPGMAKDIPVTMAGMTYSPPTIAAKVGDTLVLTNDDAADHNVFVATVGHAVDLGKQKPGETLTLNLGKVGKFEIECVIHPEMMTVVEVQQ